MKIGLLILSICGFIINKTSLKNYINIFKNKNNYEKYVRKVYDLHIKKYNTIFKENVVRRIDYFANLIITVLICIFYILLYKNCTDPLLRGLSVFQIELSILINFFDQYRISSFEEIRKNNLDLNFHENKTYKVVFFIIVCVNCSLDLIYCPMIIGHLMTNLV